MMSSQYRRRDIKHFRNSDFHGSVEKSESLTFLNSIPSQTAALVFIDPPFNLGKAYSKKRLNLDRMPEQKYEAWILSVLDECARILKPGGTLYLYHIPKWALKFGAHLNETMTFRNWIAIAMKNGYIRAGNLYPAHYALLSFSKGKPNRFAVPKLRPVRCRHCNEYIKDYGGYLPIIEERGINLSDFWDDISPVRHKRTKNRAANELPAILFDRILSISGEKGELFVDPFAGSGTSVLTAAKFGMKFKCCDVTAESFKLTISRLIDLRAQIRSEMP